MARWRQAVELGMTDEEIGTLAAIARSRSEAARRVERYCSLTGRIPRSLRWGKDWTSVIRRSSIYWGDLSATGNVDLPLATQRR
jgi:hypothetical protein